METLGRLQLHVTYNVATSSTSWLLLVEHGKDAGE